MNFKELNEETLNAWKEKYPNLTETWIDRPMLSDVIKNCSTFLDPVAERELLLAGYLGTLWEGSVSMRTLASILENYKTVPPSPPYLGVFQVIGADSEGNILFQAKQTY